MRLDIEGAVTLARRVLADGLVFRLDNSALPNLARALIALHDARTPAAIDPTCECWTPANHSGFCPARGAS